MSTSLLALQQAEINRDRKKRRRPYEIEDFYLFWDQRDGDSVDSKYGAAALEMRKLKIFPNWALSIYADLVVNADGVIPPDLLCYQAAGILLLGPKIVESSCKCMLIADYEASGKILDVSSPKGETIKVQVPTFTDAFIARENVYIDIID
jgi:hypothetical protein